MVAEADLVLGMAREHVREVIVVEPAAWDLTFTLKELVRRATPNPRQAEPLGAWLQHLSAGRQLDDVLGASTDDDVPDLVGRSLETVREGAASVDGLVTAWPGSRGPWRSATEVNDPQWWGARSPHPVWPKSPTRPVK